MEQPTIQRSLPPVPPPVRLPLVVKKKRLKPAAVKGRRPGKSAQRPKRGPQAVRHEISAGGVVAREERGSWLVALLKTEHKRGQVWVLPKGHVEPDKNETVADAARREVEEEAGIKDISIKNELGITRYRFQAENALVKKTVHYFLMTTGQRTLVPQAEEGLLEAAWFPIQEAIRILAYDTDRDIVIRAQEQLLHPDQAYTPSIINRRPRQRPLRIHT